MCLRLARYKLNRQSGESPESLPLTIWSCGISSARLAFVFQKRAVTPFHRNISLAFLSYFRTGPFGMRNCLAIPAIKTSTHSTVADPLDFKFVDHLRLTCPACGRALILTRIESEEPGFDLRTYYCAAAGRTKPSSRLPKAKIRFHAAGWSWLWAIARILIEIQGEVIKRRHLPLIRPTRKSPGGFMTLPIRLNSECGK